MIMFGSLFWSPDPMSRAFFTVDTSSALPAWIVRRELRVDSSIPALLRRLVSLIGVRTRAMHG